MEETPAAATTPTPASTLLAPPPDSFNRLSQPFISRLPIYFTVTGLSGFLLGVRKGGEEAGLRFRAENAHRLPHTQAGWYLYHKSKNYHIALGGIYEGVRNSWRLAPWAALFALMEEEIDQGRAAVVREWRSHRDGEVGAGGVAEGEVGGDGERLVTVAGNKDFISTMLATMTTAGAFAAWKRMPLPTAVRLMKMGAKVGMGFGLAQDAINLLHGRRLGYVEYIKRHTFGAGERKRNEVAAAIG